MVGLVAIGSALTVVYLFLEFVVDPIYSRMRASKTPQEVHGSKKQRQALRAVLLPHFIEAHTTLPASIVLTTPEFQPLSESSASMKAAAAAGVDRRNDHEHSGEDYLAAPVCPANDAFPSAASKPA
jgi:hypothetical protein